MKPGEAGTLLVTGATGRVGAALISRLGGIVPMRAASRGEVDVGAASGVAFDEVAAILTRELGRDIRCRPLSPVAFAAKRIRSGVDPMMALVMTGLYTVQRLGKTERVTDTAARLPRRPATSMESYVHRSRAVFAPT